MKKILLVLFLFTPVRVHSQELPPTYPSHYFIFSESDSLSYPELYPDQSTRDSIAVNYRNSHRRAKAIEAYALNEQGIDFLHRSVDDQKQWILKLTTGEKIHIGPAPRSDVSDYNFEYYYPSVEILVFRAQWYEGNNYVLVSRRSGNYVKTFGPPVFSPSKQFFVSFSGRDFTSYNRNGIQLFELTDDGIIKLIEYITKPAPSRVKWTDDENFALEVFEARLVPNQGMMRTYQHYDVTIRETTSE